MSSEQVTVSRTEFHGQTTNASAVIDGGDAGFVSFIDSRDGRGLLLRFYNEQTGTQDVARLTKEDAAALRQFLFKFETDQTWG